jgi:hypothetical protein
MKGRHPWLRSHTFVRRATVRADRHPRELWTAATLIVVCCAVGIFLALAAGG